MLECNSEWRLDGHAGFKRGNLGYVGKYCNDCDKASSQWPEPSSQVRYTLRLNDNKWGLDEYHVSQNLDWLERAKGRGDIDHLYVPVQSCSDSRQRRAMEDLIASTAEREWKLTLDGTAWQASDFKCDDGLLCFLRSVDSVQFISLGSFESDDTFNQILQVVAHYPSLREICLDQSMLNLRRLQALGCFLAFPAARGLSQISFGPLKLEASIGIEVLRASLFQILQQASHVTKWTFRSLPDELIIEILNELRDRTRIESLDLLVRRNHSQEVVLLLTDWIKDNASTLGHLGLSFQAELRRDSPVDISPLLEAIRSNTTLEELEIEKSDLGDGDILHLAQVVPSSALKRLKLVNNNLSWRKDITEEGADTLLKLLKSCPHLVDASIDWSIPYIRKRHPIPQECHLALDTQSILNEYRSHLLPVNKKDIPIALWPDILSKMDKLSKLKGERTNKGDAMAHGVVFDFMQLMLMDMVYSSEYEAK